MSSSVKFILDGQPSIITPTDLQCDSPNVVSVKKFPKVGTSCDRNTLRQCLKFAEDVLDHVPEKEYEILFVLFIITLATVRQCSL